MNSVRRLWGVLFSPIETFRDIVARPYSQTAALAIIAVNLVATLLMLPKLLAFTTGQLELMPVEGLSAEELAAVQSIRMVAAGGGAILAALVGPVVIWLICALALKLLNMFKRNEVPFRQLFAVAVYAYVPVLLGALVVAVMVMFGQAENVPYAGTNLAVLFPGLGDGFLYDLLSRLDPFVFWTVALLGVGTAEIMRESVRKMVGYLVLLWGLYVLLMAVFW